MDKSDQWNRDGNCEECRKKQYCGTPCRASEERRKDLFRSLMREAVMNVLGKKV